ncbi:fructose-bisphosphate aldolase, class II [Pediococcus acidilactici NGRI 0510Q]|uniref:Ketose-bisphosphate aldolase n=1 Tax=Pediococcus acidilactici TaxID=1254 RepID=A0AAW8YJ60_PEDAC|nr:ketose-bisphosphate aldolase [Pediococcus acidilactici]GAC45691.1 fructose-bisphosphate aldolase, class II [Pediococcus acidilactici NGRI 0510Q]KAF0424646.1 ketose-bisphosphate aldolase [Pediococcus acidilactici]KRN90467.1 fructose-bisphosphate aldolase, class II [Pediococcus acidilactici]MDV2621806.1 ketose-bisphosphate aldolase [Pediococcus acidilactici]QQC13963.1 ketose-bisphosphate aldolase [Pediococcus acidilactici]
MLINMNQLLSVAKKNNFAVGAYNVSNAELLKSAVEQCEADNAPAIIAVHPTEMAYAKDDFFAYVLQRIRNSKIPFVLHLDHGDTLENVARAIHNGFSSVMIDASLEEWQNNVDITRKTVDMCHLVGVSVEAELGTIGQTGNHIKEHLQNGIYTKPEDAERFVDETGVDTLAVGIGTAHGIYPTDVEPKIRIDILKQITDVVDIPLVLHGGSSNPDSQIADAVHNGISKVNISSDYKYAFFKEARKILKEDDGWDPNNLFPKAIEAAKEVVHHKNELFDSLDKADLYQGMDPWRGQLL